MFHFSNFTNDFLVITFVRVSIVYVTTRALSRTLTWNDQQRAATKAVIPGAITGREERTLG